MRGSNRRTTILGLAGGVGAAACVGLLMGQAGTQPGRGQEFFVTGSGSQAYLWQRDGTTLRMVGQGNSTGMLDPRDTNRPMDPSRPVDPSKPLDPNRPDPNKPTDPSNPRPSTPK